MKTKLLNFMRGRYGNDELNMCLVVLSAVCMLVGIFIKGFSSLGSAFIVYAFFRMLSKNTQARRRENARVVPYISFVKAKIKTDKSAKVFLCPRCKRTLRVPSGKGKITLSCPCGEKLRRKS